MRTHILKLIFAQLLKKENFFIYFFGTGKLLPYLQKSAIELLPKKVKYIPASHALTFISISEIIFRIQAGSPNDYSLDIIRQKVSMCVYFSHAFNMPRQFHFPSFTLCELQLSP